MLSSAAATSISCRLPEGGPWGLGRAGRDWPDSVREVRSAALDADSVDAVVLQRPEEVARSPRRWAGGRAGTCRPSTWNTTRPRGMSRHPVHPLADQHAIPVVHVTHFNGLFWDNGSAPAHRDRARHR